MRRTIEVIVETEELLIVNGRSSVMPLKCPACGAPLKPLTLGAIAASPYADALDISSSDSAHRQNGEGHVARENPQAEDFRPIRRLQE